MISMRIVKLLFFYISISFFAVFFYSCESDDEIKTDSAKSNLVVKAKEFLTGDIVLSAHATMNGVNKTLLPTGCPTKFNFAWKDAKTDTLTISLLDFTVGKMGMIINFKCDVTTMPLNSWEKDEYRGDGWFKFYGKDGHTWGQNNEGNPSDTKGSSVKGYFNVNTHEINFIVDYNMMNVRSECFLQVVDKTRINRFDEEFAQYEADLKKWKEEHGLN